MALSDRVEKHEWELLKSLPYLIFGYIARSEAKSDFQSPVTGEIRWSIQRVTKKEEFLGRVLQSPSEFLQVVLPSSTAESRSHFVELFQSSFDKTNFVELTEDALEEALDPYEDGVDEELTSIESVLEQSLNEDEYITFCKALFMFVQALSIIYNEHDDKDLVEVLASKQERDIHLLRRIFS